MRECRFLQFRFLLTLVFATGIALTACGTQSRQKHLTRGEEYLQKRRFEAAMMEFRAAGDIDPESAEAHWGLARAFENLARYEDTLAELRETVRLAPDNLEAKAKLGNLYLVGTPPNVIEAAKLVEDIFARNPNFVEGYILKAGVFAAERRGADDVLAILNQAVAVNPNRTETYLSLARYLVKIKRSPEAEQAIQKGIAVNPSAVSGYLEYGRFLSYAERPAEAETQFARAVEIAPNDIEARESFARFYLAQGQYDRAENAYQKLVEVQGSSPESRLELANFYVAAGRPADARQTLTAIIAEHPEYARARYRLGEILLEQHETNLAVEQTDALLKINDTDAEALMLRARVRLQENDNAAAVNDLTEVLKKQPTEKDALFYMAQARLALGQTDQARAFIGDLEKYHPEFLKTKLLKIQANFADGNTAEAVRQANDLLSALKNSYPSQETDAQNLKELRMRALTARGLGNLELGNVAEARADLQTVQSFSPNSSAATVNLAKTAVAAKNTPEAVGLYERALNLDARNFDALNGLVNLHIKQKQFEQAHVRLNQTLANSAPDANRAALHYLNANVFTAQNDADAAAAELQKSLEIDDSYLPAYSSYAAILIGKNQTEQAIEQYRKIVERKPSAAIYTLLGILEDARSNAAEAEKNYRRALEIAPESPMAANNLAWSLAANRGNLDEALTLSQTVVGRNGATATYLDTLGWVFYKKELYSQAVEQFRKAVALDEANAWRNGTAANPAYRLRLGMALASAGDKFSAKREVESSLANAADLSPREAEDARVLLASL